MLLAKLPMQLAMAILYITMVYLFTDQPLEPQRIAMFFTISVLVSLASESLGLLIASRLSVVVSVHGGYAPPSGKFMHFQ
jgi:ABC-2 type transporter